jgi:hypothetical protein
MPATRLLFLLALCPAYAHAEIYACTDKGRMPVYQNFPCEFDRLGSMPPTQPGAQAPVEPVIRSQQARGAAATPVRDRAARPRGATVPPRPSMPRVGMTSEEVRAVWGEPSNSSKEELAKRDIEVWNYADSRSVVFDRKGIVTAVHW